jgi:2-polyprenyl-6-methoxyphenol hydroxylase-like FAD-dependent oxidoreductase
MTHFAIAGAGIAGLATAILLTQQDKEVTLFDQVKDPTPVGAGLLLQPSGQAMLQRLNLLEVVREHAAQVNSLQGYSKNWRSLNLHYRDAHPDWYGLGIHRASLHQILWQRAIACGVHFKLGVAIDDFDSDATGITLHNQVSGERFDALIVANGTRSTLREKLPLRQHHQAYPWGAYWAVLESESWPFPDILMQRYRGAQIMMGILPTGRNPITQRTCYSLFWSLPRSDFAIYHAEGLPGLIARIEKIWPEVAAWLGTAPETTIAIAEYADVRMSSWHHENIVVIGDAAHAMSPQLGQGANMALIDATVLAQSLGKTSSIATAFQKYSEKRAKHIAYNQMGSRIMTPLYQSHYPLGWARDVGTTIGRHISPIYRQYLLTLCGAKQGFFDFEASIDNLTQ